MQIGSYIFQSPFSQPVQVGRPDPAMVKEQQQESEKTQQKTQESISGISRSEAKGNRLQRIGELASQTTSGVLQTNQMAQQLMQSFQVANRSNYIQAYTQNSLSS